MLTAFIQGKMYKKHDMQYNGPITLWSTVYKMTLK